jgi:hypothetical protein
MGEMFTVDRKEFFRKLTDDETEEMCLYVNREDYQIEIEVNAWEPFKANHNNWDAIRFDKSDLIRYRDIEYSTSESSENVEKNIEPVSIWISDGDLMNIMSKTERVAVKHSKSRTDTQINKVTFEVINECPQHNAVIVKSEHIKKIMRYSSEQDFYEIPVNYPVIIYVDPSRLTNAIIKTPDCRIKIDFCDELRGVYTQGIKVQKAVHVDVENQIMTINVPDIIEILDIDKYISNAVNMIAYSKWSDSKTPYKFRSEAFREWRASYINAMGVIFPSKYNEDKEVKGFNILNHTKNHGDSDNKKGKFGVCGYSPHDYSRLEDETIIRELTTIYKLKKKIECFVEEDDRWNWFGLRKSKSFKLHDVIEELALFEILNAEESNIKFRTSLGDMVVYRSGGIYYYGNLERYMNKFMRIISNNATIINNVLSRPQK